MDCSEIPSSTFISSGKRKFDGCKPMKSIEVLMALTQSRHVKVIDQEIVRL
jgi:hypothetical protein